MSFSVLCGDERVNINYNNDWFIFLKKKNGETISQLLHHTKSIYVKFQKIFKYVVVKLHLHNVFREKETLRLHVCLNKKSVCGY